MVEAVKEFLSAGGLFPVLVIAAFAICIYIEIRKRSKVGRTSLDYSPRGDRVIVKQLPPPPPIDGDVVLPDSQRKALNEGTVVAVGPSRECDDIEVGQHVCFLDFAGSAIKIDGEDYLAMREVEIHGIRKDR